MKNCKLLFLAVTTTGLFLGFSSCKKDSKSIPALTIKDTTQTVSENVGTANVTINLSQAPGEKVKLNVQLTGDAILNGDYSVDSATSLTIPAGSTTASLKFTIFNDPVVEPMKSIHVKFTAPTSVTFTNAEATVKINDDDVSKANTGLQTDLLWNAGSPVNLDLFVVNNVVITNNQITDFDVVSSSENTNGFESVLINNSSPDGEYYLVVFYNSGTRNVNFTLNSAGPNISGVSNDDTFTSSEAGTAIFYGPITKNGSTYSRQTGNIFNLNNLKSYVYHGRVSQ